MSPQRLQIDQGWHLWGPRVLAGFVGLVFLLAAVLKSADMELFIRQIKAYGIVSHRPLLMIAAWGLIVLEMALGVALLVAYRVKAVFLTTILLLSLFLAVTGWGWFTGATEACGCFGPWLERTQGEAALEDLVLLTLTVLAWAGFRRLQVSQARWKTWAVLSACVMGLALPAAVGFPFSRIEQSGSGTGEKKLGDFAVQGLEGVDLNSGTYLIVVMGTGCEHCQETVPEINMLAETPGLPSVIGLCVNDESDRAAFVEQFQPMFSVGQIDENVFWRLLGDGDMPRTILAHNGYVKQVWDLTPPTAEAIRVPSPS
jgi:uncharacterized membrane protein YphA (DoxX/SURF4 family)